MGREYQFFVYIMSNYQKRVFYIGVSNDLVRRILEHQLGIGSVFTSKYHLKCLVYFEMYGDVYAAINREKELKGWKRFKKINLIHTINPEMKDLSSQHFKDCGFSEKDLRECGEELMRRYRCHPEVRHQPSRRI
jgi:putative endonuclease